MKNKRRCSKLGVLFLVVLFLLTACGQNQKNYEELAYRLESLEKAYNQLLIETEEWLKFSDLEREFLLEKLDNNETMEESPNQENIIVLKNDNLEGDISL